MTKNHISKPPRETTATSSTHRSSLWKRIGRRGSKTPTPSQLPPTPPGGAIPLKSIRGDATVEADIGDVRSMGGNRSERRNSKSNGKGGGAGGLIRKLKSSFRNTPTNFSSDLNQSMHEADDSNFVMVAEHKRFATSSRPNSPAYSTDSYATVEVGRI
jgi:hypothetical protein